MLRINSLPVEGMSPVYLGRRGRTITEELAYLSREAATRQCDVYGIFGVLVWRLATSAGEVVVPNTVSTSQHFV